MACASSTQTPPQSPEPRSEEAPPSSAAVEPDASPEPVVDEPVVEVPVVEGRWRPPLPAVSLETLDDDEFKRSNECFETHPVTDPEADPKELMAAAACLRGARSYGKEVSIYRLILARYSDQPLAMEAMRSMGLRFEQMENWSGALDTYETYLERYPKQEDARALGLRYVCVARVLEDLRREEKMLSTLEKVFGRKGFVRPTPQQLPTLCEETKGE